MVNEMDFGKPTTPTDNSLQKEPTKMVTKMDLSNPTTKTDNSNGKEPTKTEN
jgi:hypothetical protein